MAHSTTAFIDSRKKLHPTPDDATIADLVLMLGGAPENTASARAILTNRARIEQLFAEHDAMVSTIPAPAAQPEHDLT
mgnify:CR=1 FL=1